MTAISQSARLTPRPLGRWLWGGLSLLLLALTFLVVHLLMRGPVLPLAMPDLLQSNLAQIESGGQLEPDALQRELLQNSPALPAAPKLSPELALVQEPEPDPLLVVCGTDAALRFLRGLPLANLSLQVCRQGKAMQRVADGHADLAVICVTTDGVPLPRGLQRQVMGRFVPVLVRHADNKVVDLRTVDIQGIYSGKIQDWQQLGGKPGPIRLLSSAARARNDGLLPPGSLLAGSIGQRGLTDAEVLRRVRRDPHALGVVAQGAVNQGALNQGAVIQGTAGDADSLISIRPESSAASQGATALGYTVQVIHRLVPEPEVQAVLAQLLSGSTTALVP